jgi:hypothetical protein
MFNRTCTTGSRCGTGLVGAPGSEPAVGPICAENYQAPRWLRPAMAPASHPAAQALAPMNQAYGITVKRELREPLRVPSRHDHPPQDAVRTMGTWAG